MVFITIVLMINLGIIFVGCCFTNIHKHHPTCGLPKNDLIILIHAQLVQHPGCPWSIVDSADLSGQNHGESW
jgi:hypothetical protein